MKKRLYHVCAEKFLQHVFQKGTYMKKICIVITFVFLLCVPDVKAQFEGEMALKTTRKIKDKFTEALVSIFIKNDKLMLKVKDEQEMGKDVTIIYRGDKKSFWIVTDKEKSYLEIPIKDNDDEEMAGEMKGARKGKKSPVNVKKTGKTETILGYACDEYIINEGDEEKDIWGTGKLGDLYDGFMKAFGQLSRKNQGHGMEGWQSELMKLKIFPLKSATKTKGDVTSSEEVTKIEKKSLSASLFEVPADYKKTSLDFDMNSMMKSMREQMKNGKGAGKDIDVQKMMEEMKEKMKGMNKEGEDSSKDNE